MSTYLPTSLVAQTPVCCLKVTEQTCLKKENYSHSCGAGVYSDRLPWSPETFVVVKNTPFTIVIDQTGDKTFDFRTARFQADLYYDVQLSTSNDNSLQKVNFVKRQPISYNALVTGNSVTLSELKIKVLTSQHEGSLFRIRVRALDPSGNDKLIDPSLDVYSAPIKVISKPDLKGTQRGGKRKRQTANSKLVEMMEKVLAGQQKQQEMLEDFKKNNKLEDVVFSIAAPLADGFPPLMPAQAYCDIKQEEIMSSNDFTAPCIEPASDLDYGVDLEESFRRFLRDFALTAPTTRARKLRKVIHDNEGTSKGVVDTALLEMNSEIRHLRGDGFACDCVVCPHRVELDGILGEYLDH